jgi:Fur family ferric uptake transcriptional regulator
LQVESISNNQSQKQSRSSHLALRKSGKRVTSQRALILDIIQEGKGHLDADEIYRRARAVQPRISLSTVYRTLKAFKEPGLIEELHFDDSHHHYEMKPARKHHHMVCLGCGKIVEFRYSLARHLKGSVPEVKDFEIVDAELHLTGYCSQCRQKKG